MQAFQLLPRAATFALGLALFAGCGGNTADVSGTVTLDGEPLADASIIFTPQSDEEGGGGRPAVAVTDSQGRYELVYGRGVTGAVPGTYLVEIRTYREPNEDAETPEQQQGAPEKVPAKYNANSQLIETVDAGGSVIDFDLDSEGEIQNPAGAGGS